MLRVRTVGQGWTGAPGLTTFYFDSADTSPAAILALVTRVRQYFVSTAPIFHNTTTWTTDPEVAELDPATGAQVASFVASASPASVVGTGGASIGPPMTMILLRLITSTFISGRKLQGHTNVGPVADGVIQGDGTPATASLATVVAAGGVLLDLGGASPDLLVWHRPVGGAGGSTGSVVGVACPDKFAVLRSRRD